ncbi:MAG TPA: allantoinase AllB [Vicinamibacterales bacterium]|nr:allantoinase AllB [Vicinamibacterales bacterium]
MTILRGRRVVLPDGVREVDIEIRDGRITAITDSARAPHVISGVIDAGDLVVLPGLVDSHVHVNEPGRTDWEGFVHATRAAAAGGVTTIVDMPLNSVPATTTVDALDMKRRAAARESHVDVAFWGGVVPGNISHLEPLAAAGVLGFKCFLCPSGVDEFPHVSEDDLAQAMPVLSALGLPLLVHAEWPDALCEPAGARRSHATWLESRPAAAEQQAIERLVRLAADHRAWIHIVHLASPAALETITAARARGVAITVETCPHYLTFAAEAIRDGATTFKCAPPIRTAEDRDGLWRGLINGEIDLVASDHSPSPPALKCGDTGDFVEAWGGIASLQVSLPAVWTGARKRGLGVECLAEWMAAAPARLAGIDSVKGRIAVGCDADLVLFDPTAMWTVDPHQLYHRHAQTPYEGMTLTGQVRTTFLRGQIVYDARVGTGAPRGKLLTGPRARVE